jgi:hypothetical protein
MQAGSLGAGVRPIAWAAVLLGCISCVSSARKAEIEQVHRSNLDQIYQLGLSKVVSPMCAASKKLAKPSTHLVTTNGFNVEQGCGMVAAEVLDTGAIAVFVERVCGGVDSPDCGHALRKTFLARLEGRYAFTDWESVASKCTAYPVECQQLVNVELWTMEAHNDGVFAWMRTATRDSTAKRDAELEQAYAEALERRRAWGAALQGFAAGWNAPRPQTVKCLSQTIGTMTTTTRC